MGDTTQYVQVGFLLITVSNLIIVGLLIVVFVLAVVLRRPTEHQASMIEPAASSAGGATANWEDQP